MAWFASSTFGNTNFFGSFLAMCTVFMALYLIKEKNVLVLSYFFLMLSMTRSSWLVCFCYNFWNYICYKKSNKELLKEQLFYRFYNYIWILNLQFLEINWIIDNRLLLNEEL